MYKCTNMEIIMSRLSIELTPEQHNAIKAMALLEGVNIKEFVVKRVFAKMPAKPKSKKAAAKKPNARLMAALEDSLNVKGKKRYKTAAEFFDRYR